MPWKVVDVMDQRERFALRAMNGLENFTELCREFGISRKTGYKWKERFLERGLGGLGDKSRRPKSNPSELCEDVVCRIIELKNEHPSWGPAKIRGAMIRLHKDWEIPSETSFKRVLDKAGLVKRRRRVPQQETGRVENRVKSLEPNHIWTIDFKGWWRTRDFNRFEPLTIRDDYSRFILLAEAVGTKGSAVRSAMEGVFSTYGLPKIIRSDNGTPFAAANTPLGLTKLSCWWLSLGIDLDRIRPGKPQENGGHERMHRDIATEIESQPAATVQQQQVALDGWRKTFNHDRPHASIGGKVPADVYCHSERPYDSTDVELKYPPGFLVRRVYNKGRIKVCNQEIHVSEALLGHDVGLESLAEGHYRLWFGNLALGEVNVQTRTFKSGQPTKKE